ncbi:hypothetical protein [Sulfitobacter sp.]|uniref:hypothetical protein n=1 Tax=Sulfitobacter sp. TaxID=1903071 RepID=UPI00300394A2
MATIDNRKFRFAFITAASFLLVFVAACTPSYINTQDYGAPATEQEIRNHYSGNSIKYPLEVGGKSFVEAYFSPDGTYRMVALNESVFGEGTWKVHTALSRSTLIIQTTDYFVGDGQADSRAWNGSFVIYTQPDGSVFADQMGGGNSSQPKPTRGFKAQSRWNSLRRQAGF